MGTFIKITFLQYFNIAVVGLLISMNANVAALETISESAYFPILNGNYSDFSTRWYRNIGASLCFTLFINTVSPQVSKLGKPNVLLLKRCLDRGCKCSIKKGDNDECNTKKILQSEIDDLYTGPQIQTYFVYAQYFTSLWAILTYSSSMPVLYPIGCLNFFVLYWAYKFLLVKHYSKTTSFNHKLPLFTINFFKIGVILHLGLGAFMFSNSNILSAKNLYYLKWVQEELGEVAKEVRVDQYVFFERFSSGLALLYFLFVLLLFLMWLFQKVTLAILSKLFSILIYIICCGDKSKNQIRSEEQQQKQEATSQDILVECSIDVLGKWYNRLYEEMENFKQI